MSVTISKPANSMVLRPQSFNELTQFAQMAAKSALVPRDYQGKPENVMLAVQMGSEVGLAPMQALQNIAVVNGRPAIWGDAMLGLVKASGLLVDIIEKVEGEGDAMTAICTVKRANSSPVAVSFSVADAKKAGLWGKQGPWTQYPKRMLQLRSRGFALRDTFPDVLKGLISAEEAQDIPVNQAEPIGQIIDVEPEQPKTETRKPTWREWIGALRADVEAAKDRDAVMAIMWREDVQRAFAAVTGDKADELQKVQDMADAKFPPPATDAEFVEAE